MTTEIRIVGELFMLGGSTRDLDRYFPAFAMPAHPGRS
jgi:hypothetical protein